MLVYKHLSTFQCSFIVPICHTFSFGCMPQMLVYKHLSTCRCSCIVHICHTKSFGLAPKCLYTSISALFSAHSSFRTCAQMLVYKHLSTFLCSFMVPTYHTINFGCVLKCLYTSTWALYNGLWSSRVRCWTESNRNTHHAILRETLREPYASLRRPRNTTVLKPPH